MGDPTDTGHQNPLKLEKVAQAASELAAEPQLDRLLGRFLDQVQEWAAPSAILAAVRDPSGESGWRLLPALSLGSGPLSAERALPQLIDDTPGCLERPTLVHPGEPAPGVQPRDNCILPWAHEGDSGILVIRGIPRPAPPNLGEALALLSAPVWPRLLGSPASRVESLVVELRRVAERLEADAERHIERLRVAQPPAPADGPDEAPVLGEQLEEARREARQAATERDEARERLLALETALKEAEEERDRARDGEEALDAAREEARRAVAERDETREKLQVLKSSLAGAEKELEAARAEGEHSTLEWDELKGRVATLQEALDEAEGERDRVRDESERLSARLESIQSEHSSALEQAEEQRRSASDATRSAEERVGALEKDAEKARQDADGAIADAEELKGRVALLEEDLQRAQSDRDEARSEVERLEGERRAASETARDLEDSLAGAQRQLESARQEAQRASAEAGEMRARVGSLETTLQEVEAERDGARGQAEILEDQKRVAEATARTAEEALAGVRQQLEEVRSEEPSPAPEGSAPPAERSEKALGALRSTLSVLRRTPFVPPGLRVSIAEGRALLDEGDDSPETWLRVALLDRDASSLEPLADELEAAGVEVRIANYPEELALLMKTPDAQRVNVAICDILAFRADQTVAGLFRAWQKDRPGLAFFLTFSPDDPTETERAKRVPMSLTAGRLPRPIPGEELIEKLRVLAQKQGIFES